ncbi:MAG TPA: DNA-binding protein HU, partial [Rhodospirillaceae bacterium]|nr:DNA-binding protein HU [Rhodospirillaceae bacterium]
MNKNDLIASVASRTSLSKADSAKAIDATLASVTSSLRGGTEVRLVGFGT